MLRNGPKFNHISALQPGRLYKCGRGSISTHSSYLKRPMMPGTLEKLDPKQELLLREQCILVDRNDKKIGSASKRECHLLQPDGSPPPLHRAFSVFLFNTNNQLLLQQRSEYKITFPLHYTNSCCSHPLNNDEELNENDARGVRFAAYRRLQFELGIPDHEFQPSEFTYLTRIYYSSPSLDGKWGEHEIDYVLFLKRDLTLNPNLNEIKEVKYVSKKEFKGFLEKLKKDNIPITPWFKMIVDNLLPVWWENLVSIEKFQDHETIHCIT